MAIQSSFYVPDGSTRTFPSTKHIASKQHMAVWYRRISDGVWVVQNVTSYDLINNTAVLVEAPDVALYDNIEIRVADTYDELTDSPSEISIVAAIATEIVNVSDNMAEVKLVGENITLLVHKTGDETIGGVKTFTSSPIIPDATEADQAVSKGQLDSKTDITISTTAPASPNVDDLWIQKGI